MKTQTKDTNLITELLFIKLLTTLCYYWTFFFSSRATAKNQLLNYVIIVWKHKMEMKQVFYWIE